jgi:hypothetical protein
MKTSGEKGYHRATTHGVKIGIVATYVTLMHKKHVTEFECNYSPFDKFQEIHLK